MDSECTTTTITEKRNGRTNQIECDSSVEHWTTWSAFWIGNIIYINHGSCSSNLLYTILKHFINQNQLVVLRSFFALNCVCVHMQKHNLLDVVVAAVIWIKWSLKMVRVSNATTEWLPTIETANLTNIKLQFLPINSNPIQSKFCLNLLLI